MAEIELYGAVAQGQAEKRVKMERHIAFGVLHQLADVLHISIAADGQSGTKE